MKIARMNPPSSLSKIDSDPRAGPVSSQYGPCDDVFPMRGTVVVLNRLLMRGRAERRPLCGRMLAAAVIALSLSSSASLAQKSKGPFTQAEVVAGRANYQGYCAGCHGEYLQGFTDAPPLTGATFKFDWSKYTIRRLYEFVSKTMPQGLEGDLSAQTYSSIIAFLLAANGAKAGSAALNPNSAIRIGDVADGNTVSAVVNAPIDPRTRAGR